MEEQQDLSSFIQRGREGERRRRMQLRFPPSPFLSPSLSTYVCVPNPTAFAPLLVGKESAEEKPKEEEEEEDGGTLTAGKGGNGRGGARTKLPNEGRDSPLLILAQRKRLGLHSKFGFFFFTGLFALRSR